ncbi:MAG: DMT family transporter [bacterium]|nr:DMT family transporter [bacterium]
MSDRPQISRGKALGLLFLGAVGISFSPTLVKAVGQNVVGPTAIAFWRTLIGGIALLVLTLLQGKRLTVSRRTFLWCTFTGFVFFLDLTFWHRSILYVGSGMATMLGNTQVFSTAVLSVFIFKEKITGRFIAAAVVALVGVTMLVGLWSESVVFSSSYLRGIVLGLLTGLMYALYMVGIKKAGADESKPEPIAVVTWLCLTAALFSGIGSIFEKGAFMPPDGRSVLWLVLLGVVVQALAWWLIAHVLRAIPIHLASLVLLSQPVLAIVWGYLIFAETLVPLQIAGAIITLAAIYAGSLKSKK